MKLFSVVCICLLFFSSSCLQESNENRIYIKSVQIDSLNRVDWYMTSLFGGFSRSTVLLVAKDKEEVIVKSHGITNINIDSATKLLHIEGTDELENFGDEDTLSFGNRFNAVFSTKGIHMNDAESRFSRLQIQKINSKLPHNVNSDF